MATLETSFTIDGMSCGGCVKSVTRVLNSVPGVEPLKVDIGHATVRIDPSTATAEQAKAALERAGYPVVSEG